jgi:hypothetical protein
LPKLQHTANTSLYSSFKAVSLNNKLVLFYNDDRDNVERDLEKKPDDMVKFDKSVLAMATIDQKNNLARSVVYNHREMKLTTCIIVKGAGVFTAAKDMIGLLEVN